MRSLEHNIIEVMLRGRNPKVIEEGIFSRKKKEKIPEYPRWPKNNDDSVSWMNGKVEHYKKHHPNDLHHLFSPASGDYLPLSVHVGGSYTNNDAAKAHYKMLKKQNPDAVKKAKDLTNGIAGQVSLSRVGDHEDYRSDGHFPSSMTEETITEAKKKSGNYHVSINYTKGYNGNAEHAVQHYTIDKPQVSDEYLASASKRALKDHPDHQAMISKGFHINHDNGIHASDYKDYARESAHEVHKNSLSHTSIMKKRYGADGMGMYESNEEVEKDKKRLDTVKKVKTGNKNNQVVLNPELSTSNNADSVV